GDDPLGVVAGRAGRAHDGRRHRAVLDQDDTRHVVGLVLGDRGGGAGVVVALVLGLELGRVSQRAAALRRERGREIGGGGEAAPESASPERESSWMERPSVWTRWLK